MPNQLDLPDELKHLIEKRADDDRRERSNAAAAEPALPADVAATERRQSGRRAVDGEQVAPELPKGE
jgi:hypothetical protein